MPDDARSRQLARLPEGEKPPTARRALALAKAKAYQAAADSQSTLRAYQGNESRLTGGVEKDAAKFIGVPSGDLAHGFN